MSCLGFRCCALLCGLVGLSLSSAAIVAAEQSAPPSQQRFDQQIAPLLADRCLDCHSGPEPKGNLDLTSAQKLRVGGDNGTAIEPNDAEASLLWQRVRDDEMPPSQPLTPAEKQLLQAWIDEGAVWGSDPIDRFRFTTSRRAGYDWWSLQPLPAQRLPLPEIRDRHWPVNAIDYFVLQRLESEGLAPSAEATRRVLIRRLYFDLLGMPPSYADVSAFENDPAPDAYERLVDRLLASPHYGERWARHWLDVVRFGESDGFERNMPRNNSWPYRDWVIEALNADLPYDQFVRQQLAGDVLQPADADGIRATGFLVAGLHNTVVANNVEAQQVARYEELEDLIGTVHQGLLGLTIQCARCHDHKFDPIRQRDYYQLVAVLSGVQHGERTIETDAERQRRERRLRSADRRLQVRMAGLRQLRETVYQRVMEARDGNMAAQLPAAPLAAWSFESDARDGIGNLHGQLQGGASISSGKLYLDGIDDFVVTAPLETELREKTLEAWVEFSLNDVEQGGGGVIAVEANDGSTFDAIVYGERVPRRWMAGSNSFQRTRDLDGPDETSVNALVHVAITYDVDGTIRVFRNGALYGMEYRPDTPSPIPFSPGAARILFGKRHTGGGRPWLKGAIEEARLYNRALSPAEVQDSFAAGPNTISLEELLAAMTADERQRYDEWTRDAQRIGETIRQQADPATAYAVVPAAPPPTHVLIRGDIRQPGDPVAPASPLALESQSQFRLPADASDADRRSALANWITSRSNPLFARVMVNRMWHYHFGRGIVETPSDFGFNGGRPSHPELLDWLAAELIDSGFQLKAMHRLLVTSRTYRQAARANPQASLRDKENRWLWRKAPQRLDAESLRDAMLVAAGQLNPHMGGPGFRDVREYFNSGTTYYEPLDVQGPAVDRRTIYRFSPRGERSALLDTFDCPDPSVATPRRQATTTPLQALALLNDAFTLRMARAMADRARAAAQDSPSGVQRAAAEVERVFQYTLQRPPSPAEAESAQRLVNEFGLELLCRALMNTHEFVIIE